MPINQPSNQIKFTNVSVVRLKKGKKRFELACYKNKLLEYRSGAEKDLDNVLQVPTIFLSVSKAQTAPSAEVAKAFGASVQPDEVRQEILRKGEVQVGERERKEISERVEKEMLDIVSGRLVDPTTKRVYTPGMISKALDQLSSASGHMQQQQQHESTQEGNGEEKPAPQRKPLWTGVVPNKSAKSQALEAMKALIAWQPIPVMKARMRLRVTCPVTLLKQPVKVAPAPGGGANKEETGSHAPPSKSNNKKGGKGSKKSRKGDDDIETGSDAEPPRSNKKGGKGNNKRSARKGDPDDIETPPGGSDVESPAPKTPGTVRDKILSYIESVETQEVVGGEEWEVVGFAEPGAFKGLNEFVGHETKGRGRVEVLDMTVTKEE